MADSASIPTKVTLEDIDIKTPLARCGESIKSIGHLDLSYTL